jgi:hypothetical protein
MEFRMFSLVFKLPVFGLVLHAGQGPDDGEGLVDCNHLADRCRLPSRRPGMEEQ